MLVAGFTGHHDTEGNEVARQRGGTLRRKPTSEGHSTQVSQYRKLGMLFMCCDDCCPGFALGQSNNSYGVPAVGVPDLVFGYCCCIISAARVGLSAVPPALVQVPVTATRVGNCS